MGHRTLSLGLVFRALFLDPEAFEELRDDDNPFVEGLFLVVLVAAIAGLLAFLGQLITWLVVPSTAAIKDVVWEALQLHPWWADVTSAPGALAAFQRSWDLSWQVFPPLFGAPDLRGAALNILGWPFWAMTSWLFYGVLSHLGARLFGGRGTLNQTLGVTALAFTPWLFRGLGLIPFFVMGGVLATWQLILRYRALRTVHALSWSGAFWATLLPFLVYALVWLLVLSVGAAAVAVIVGR